jgi:hypothetical protein
MDEYTLKELGTLILDLDRCEHGRHAKDMCFDCPGGYSMGNGYLLPGTRIGTTVYGLAITVPSWADRADPAAWVVRE